MAAITPLAFVHVAAAVGWSAAWIAGGVPRARRPPLFAFEHATLAVMLVSGWALMSLRGWGLGHARWLAVKVGLALLLLLPLEGFHAYVCHVFLPRARRISGPYGVAQVERGCGLEAIVRTIGWLTLSVAVPLSFWLALAKPF